MDLPWTQGCCHRRSGAKATVTIVAANIPPICYSSLEAGGILLARGRYKLASQATHTADGGPMSNVPNQELPALEVELVAIRRWREERLTNHQRYLAEIDEEDKKLRKKLADLERKLGDNTQLREQVLNQLRKLPEEEALRSHEAMQDAIKADTDLLATRSAAFLELQELNRAELKKRLEDPDVIHDLEEFSKFSQVEQILDTLPSSYREVVEAHHATIKNRLAPLFELGHGMSLSLEVEPKTIGLVASVDPDEGPPAAFAILLPVGFAAYRDWPNREEDPAAKLAYRVVAAVTRLLITLGAQDAPIAYKDLDGALLVQVWLGDHVISPDVKEVANGLLNELVEQAWELRALALNLHTVWVSPFTIAPDETQDGYGGHGALEADPLEQPEEASVSPPPEEDNPTGSQPAKPIQVVLRRGGDDDW